MIIIKIIKITPRGYCHGVVTSLRIIYETINSDAPKPIYVLGMIVHNKVIIDALNYFNVITIDEKNKTRLELLDSITEGTVVLTAHGVSPKVITKAKEKNLNVVNATCSDVIRTHDIINEYIKKQYKVIYIGKNNHPEPEGVKGISPNNIFVVNNKSDIDKISISDSNNILVTNQTTMSIVDIFNLSEYIKLKFSNALFYDEICNATRIRQEAIMKQYDDINLSIIVGDIKSNNTQKLVDLSSVKSIRISDIHELDINILKNIDKLSVSSGASTPTAITKQVIEFLEQFNYYDINTHVKPKKLTAHDILKFY